MSRLYVVALVLGLLLLGIVVELLRRRQLREKYAALWIVVGGSGLLLATFPEVLTQAARLLGFQVPANLLFLLAAVGLTAISMHLSLESGYREGEGQRLAEEVALLRVEVQRLSNRPVDPAGGSPRSSTVLTQLDGSTPGA
jgi:hypothetical protein